MRISIIDTFLDSGRRLTPATEEFVIIFDKLLNGSKDTNAELLYLTYLMFVEGVHLGKNEFSDLLYQGRHWKYFDDPMEMKYFISKLEQLVNYFYIHFEVYYDYLSKDDFTIVINNIISGSD